MLAPPAVPPMVGTTLALATTSGIETIMSTPATTAAREPTVVEAATALASIAARLGRYFVSFAGCPC